MADRTFILHTPLDGAEPTFCSATLREGLSDIMQLDLELRSPSANLDPADFLGENFTLEVITQTGNSRYINGLASRLVFAGGDGSIDNPQYNYQLRLHSWLFLAEKSSDYRIYQNKTVPQIVTEALSNYGLPFEFRLAESYDVIPYVVMYNETILNFVRRMTQLVGLYWYIRHELGTHTIVFTDSLNPTLPDYEQIYFATPNNSRALQAEEYIRSWQIQNRVVPGRHTTGSYNFKHPKANLKMEEIVRKGHSKDNLEIYEYAGFYSERDEGVKLAGVRREQQQQEYELIDAVANVRGIIPGYTFTLAEHPRKTANDTYLILTASHSFRDNTYTNGTAGTTTSWKVEFTVRSTKSRYYPPRTMHKPRPAGAQTALVTGPAGNEIYTNEYGDIKVHFYWDPYSQKDENSSKWIRVASVWAGNKFGGMHVPRIGQEVIVDFVNGDIDCPIITGRVYNQRNMPPWDLPANATQSGILSRSSMDGGYDNANAIRFEDKKGAEQVWIQAERNMDTTVENDETHHVMHDRTKTIDHDETVFVHHDRTETVDNNETITIHNNRTERVDHNETISIGDNRTETVGKNETISIGDNRTETVGKNETITIGVNRTEQVGANENVTIGGLKTETVALAKAETIGLAKALTIGAAYQVSVGAAMNTSVALIQAEEIGLSKTTKVGKGYTIGVGTKYVLEAAQEIILKTGDASITMKSDGTIVLKGKNLQMIGENIALKADSDIKLKASKIDEN